MLLLGKGLKRMKKLKNENGEENVRDIPMTGEKNEESYEEEGHTGEDGRAKNEMKRHTEEDERVVYSQNWRKASEGTKQDELEQKRKLTTGVTKEEGDR